MVIFLVCFYIITALVVLNMVGASIVEIVMKQAIDDADARFKEAQEEIVSAMNDIHTIFAECDKDNSMELSKAEFMRGLAKPSVQRELNNVNISLQDAEEIFDTMDMDKSGILA